MLTEHCSTCIRRLAASRQVGPDAARFSEIWRAKQLEYSWVLSLAGRYEPFWALTEQALDYAFARFPDVDRSIRPLLLEAYRTLDAYPDVRETLQALRAQGLRTGILSNGDPGMLNEAVIRPGSPMLSIGAVGRCARKISRRARAPMISCFRLSPFTRMKSSSSPPTAGTSQVRSLWIHGVWVNRLGLPDEYVELAPSAVITSLIDSFKISHCHSGAAIGGARNP